MESDYEGLYAENRAFPPDADRLCITIQTYHDKQEEGREKFILRSIFTGGLGRLSKNPLTTEIFIRNVNSKRIELG